MSTPRFHNLTVKNIVQETEDCVSVSLQIPKEIQPDFNYVSGQYITFKKTFNGEELRRSYSICSAPHENELRVAIKKVEQGRFSNFACTELKEGDSLEVMMPMGNFCLNENNNSAKNYIGFASGSGITPIISLIKTVLHKEPQSSFVLIYGNKNVKSIIFKEQLEALKNKYIGRFQLIHILSREKMEADLNFGRINKEKCQQIFSKLLDIKKVDEAFICGPEEMILSAKDFLIENGVDAKKVKFELFNTPVTGVKKTITSTTSKSNDTISKVSIKVDDRTFLIDLAYDGQSILDAALANGADLPFACKGGVCCTCRAKVIAGKVDMDVNYALEPDEVDAGFVLTCQAHPRSENVEIDFDVR